MSEAPRDLSKPFKVELETKVSPTPGDILRLAEKLSDVLHYTIGQSIAGGGCIIPGHLLSDLANVAAGMEKIKIELRIFLNQNLAVVTGMPPRGGQGGGIIH